MTNAVVNSSNPVPQSGKPRETLFTKARDRFLTPSRRVRPDATRFQGDRSGSVLPIFSVALLPVFLCVGGAIDYGRAVMVRSQMQSALDSAVLAGGRNYQLTSDATAATATASSYFSYRFAPGAKPLGNPHLSSIDIDNSAYVITATAQARVPAPFLAIAGLPAFDLKVKSQSGLKMGGTVEGQDLEVSLMIDVTGSMNDSTGSGNSKLSDAKLAAKDLINALMPDGYTGGQSTRIALVPFSQYVNVGSTYYTAVTGAAPSGSASTCVTERTGADKYNDDAPGAGSWIGKYTVNSNKGTLSCAPTAKLMPLTTNKTGLKSAIDGLNASGWTAGHLGTAWAWYVLSDKWASVWPAGSKPGTPSEHLKKVAVLMTDGDYNTYFRNKTESRVQAQALCEGMKSAGITVYTVAFGTDISPASKGDLEACASSQEHFHDAQDGDALRAAFQTIAISLSQLRLTQ
jgi:Flp pilus assembly protein TadG